jgi:predicted SnoaL-like aldol condensation-catalyzing enzyme
MRLQRRDALDRPPFATAPRRTILRLDGTALAAAAIATAPTLARAQATPTADLAANKALARRYHQDIFLQGNLAVADEILTPDFVWHAPPQTTFVTGPAAVKQVATDFRSAFRHLSSTADDVIAEGDRVVIRWTSRGTVTGTSGDVAVIYTGIDIFRIANGKLAELWQNTDDYGLAQQLGQIPTAATPAAGTPAP